MSSKSLTNLLSRLKCSNLTVVENFPRYKNHRIGIDKDNRIVVLLHASNIDNARFGKSNGTHLSVLYDAMCSIKDSKTKKVSKRNYTLITLKTGDIEIQNYFLELVLIFVKKIGNTPKLVDVYEQFQKLESIFRKLSRIQNPDALGLWGELFMIESSRDPEYLIDSWHTKSNAKFDFNDGIDKLEVKTTTQNRRKHTFEVKQLQSFTKSKTIIASIKTTPTDNGKSIGDLILDLKPVLSPMYFEKLIGKVFDVIGNGFSNLEEHCYDYSMARSEQKLFDAKNIPKPGLIPRSVSNVKFGVDLTGHPSLVKTKYKSLLLKTL